MSYQAVKLSKTEPFEFLSCASSNPILIGLANCFPPHQRQRCGLSPNNAHVSPSANTQKSHVFSLCERLFNGIGLLTWLFVLFFR